MLYLSGLGYSYLAMMVVLVATEALKLQANLGLADLDSPKATRCEALRYTDPALGYERALIRVL